MKHFLIKFFASGFGTGYSPIVPGTVGSLAGVLLFFALYKLNMPLVAWFVFLAVFFFAGVWVSTAAEKLFGKHDPKQIVIDEVYGSLLFLLFIPLTKTYIIVGFVIFRILDVLKPFPAYRSQKLPGGWGIMIDDLIVGFYTGILMRGFIWIKDLFVR